MTRLLAPRRSPVRAVAVASALLLAFVGAACSGGSSVETGERPELPRAADAAPSPLPEVAVWDVGATDWVQFADVVPAETPVVLWFWAPHCPACAAEAADMVAFAEEHEGEIEVVGIGTQDDAGMAAEFVERHGIEFRMLWDESFETWSELGVRSQPAAALFSAEGEPLDAWTGSLPEDEVERLASAAL